MKRILFAITMLLFLPAAHQVRADASVSINFFYDNIGSDGNWVELADYGYCWQPSVAVSNVKWRPYTDGYWAYTNLGWTWISYEDFGWATYHYGRWVRLQDRGWFWVPGRQWGPAWVSWRMGGDYVGWAPLPPRGPDEFVDDRTPITGQVDLVYDIGPAYYNFIDVRYIGEPVLRDRIYEPAQNITYIGDTVNVTNITYVNSKIYDYGADYNTVNRYSSRPIQQMTVELNSNVDPSTAVKNKQVVKVQGDRIMVAAPPVLQKPSTPIAPKTVKEKIQKPSLDHGWKDVGDPKKETELKQKMKTEDPRRVPPPALTPTQNAQPSQKLGTSGATPPGKSPLTATPANPVRPSGTSAPSASAQPALTPARGKDTRTNASPMPTAGTQPKAAPTPARKASEKTTKERTEKPSNQVTSPDAISSHEGAGHEKGVKTDKGAERASENQPPKEPAAERTRKPKGEPAMTPANRQSTPDRQSNAPQHKRGGEKKSNEPAPSPH
jgi:hypothetical protein